MIPSLQTSLADAQGAVFMLYEEVKRHTSAVVVAAKDGELLSHISQTSLAASEQLGALRDELRQQSYMSRLLPVDKTVKVLARSLAVVAIAADQLNSVDERYQVSAQLHDAALKAVAKARAAITTAQATVDTAQSAMTGAAEAVVGASNATLQAQQAKLDAVVAALQEVQARVTTEAASFDAAYVEPARTLLRKATEEVEASVAHIRAAPLAEMPVLAGLEALHLARAALTVVGDAVTAKADAAAAGVREGLEAARERAVGLVGEATTSLQAALHERIASATAAVGGGAAPAAGAPTADTSLSQSLLALASAGVDAAVRKAASLDVSHGLTVKMKAADEQYNLTQKAEALVQTASATVADLNRQHGLADKAVSLVDKAKSLDANLTGGVGASLAEKALAVGTSLSTAGLAYFSGLVDTFNATKAELAGGAAAAGGGGATAEVAAATTVVAAPADLVSHPATKVD